VPSADPDAVPPCVSLDWDDAGPCRLAFDEWRESVQITGTTVRVTYE
jgi:hypothetical protein